MDPQVRSVVFLEVVWIHMRYVVAGIGCSCTADRFHVRPFKQSSAALCSPRSAISSRKTSFICNMCNVAHLFKVIAHGQFFALL
jgi:hypothetical protein